MERDFLTALPDIPFPVYREEIRPVYDDGLISVDGTRYSVPVNGIGNAGTVTVRVHPHHIEVLSQQGQIVATHKKPEWPGGAIINQDHYAAIKRAPRERMGEIERRFLVRFPGTDEFLLGLKRRMKTLAHLHLRELFRLVGPYGEESVKEAIARAGEYRNYNSYAVKRILHDRFPLISPDTGEGPPGVPAGPGLIADVDVGDFADYGQYSRDEEDKEKPAEDPEEDTAKEEE